MERRCRLHPRGEPARIEAAHQRETVGHDNRDEQAGEIDSVAGEADQVKKRELDYNGDSKY
jgi:hypothetical protein